MDDEIVSRKRFDDCLTSQCYMAFYENVLDESRVSNDEWIARADILIPSVLQIINKDSGLKRLLTS